MSSPGVRKKSAVAVVRPLRMTVDAAMTPHPVCIRRHAAMHEAAEIVAFSQATELMVVDDDGSFVGVLSALDILRAAMPDLDEITAEGGTVETAMDLFVSRGHTLAGTRPSFEPREEADRWQGRAPLAETAQAGRPVQRLWLS